MFGKSFDARYLEEMIRKLETRVSDLHIEIEKLKTHINSLRGLINRKFAIETQTEEFKYNDGLDNLRK